MYPLTWWRIFLPTFCRREVKTQPKARGRKERRKSEKPWRWRDCTVKSVSFSPSHILLKIRNFRKYTFVRKKKLNNIKKEFFFYFRFRSEPFLLWSFKRTSNFEPRSSLLFSFHFRPPFSPSLFHRFSLVLPPLVIFISIFHRFFSV